MSGANYPCEYCGKMVDDFPKYDCCRERSERMATVRKMMRVEEEYKLQISWLITEIFSLCNNEKEADRRGKMICEALSGVNKKL